MSTSIHRSANTSGIATQNAEEQDLIELYPNPSSGNLTISGLPENENSTIKITDVNGKTVYSQSTTHIRSDLDLLPLANGIYLVEIQIGTFKLVKKLVLPK